MFLEIKCCEEFDRQICSLVCRINVFDRIVAYTVLGARGDARMHSCHRRFLRV